MSRHLLLCGVLCLGCAASRTEQKETPPAAVAPVVLDAVMGALAVKGGEVVNVGDARVIIKRVTYLNQPCPKDVQCVHSGVVKSVQFSVERGADHEDLFVAEGTARTAMRVQVKVNQVAEGPVAQVEISEDTAVPLKP